MFPYRYAVTCPRRAELRPNNGAQTTPSLHGGTDDAQGLPIALWVAPDRPGSFPYANRIRSSVIPYFGTGLQVKVRMHTEPDRFKWRPQEGS